MVNMASNMGRGRVRPTTKNDIVMQHGSHEVAILQLTGRSKHEAIVYSGDLVAPIN